MKLLTKFSRLFIGILFIISGLIKANDPTGFAYKLDEYFEVLSMPSFIPFSIYIAGIICIIEVGLGVMLLAGYKPKFTVWLLLVLMVKFLFLTFYSAYYDKVKDCGCFGDALKLTPWQSFTKDVVLFVFILVLLVGLKYIKPIKKAGLISFAGLVAVTVFTIYCYTYLPIKDFMPYAVGKDIKKQMEIPKDAPRDSVVMEFIYSKDGKEFHFGMNNLPADLDKYKYVDRKDKVIRKGFEPAIHDFKIFKPTGEEVTDTFLNQKGYKLMVISYDLTKATTRSQPDVNKVVNYVLLKKGIAVWAITASSDDIIAQYTKQHQVPYTFYRADATMLKTIIRSSPGLLLLKDNVVIKKWPGTCCPSTESIFELVRE
ncbi:MAG: DoxX family protein [Bacteroidetes bacterium]|nr:DoxX family protein [Bacteroidota bacterium]